MVDPPSPARRPDRLSERIRALPRWVLPVVVAALALLIRWWVLVEQQSANALFQVAILDDEVYLDRARQVVAGKTGGTAWFLAPLYPWLLAAASRIGRLDLATASTVSVAFGTASAALCALAGRALHSEPAGWIAGLLYALGGTFVFHDVLPGQEPVLVFLHLLGFLLTLRLLREHSFRTAAGLGVVCGVAMLGRSTSGLIVVAALGALLLRRPPWRRLLLSGVWVVAGVLVVLLPAAVRNHSAVGDFTPFPWSGGPNLFITNGPDSRTRMMFGSEELAGDPRGMEADARRIAEADAGRTLRPSEISSYWTRRTLDSIDGVGDVAPHIARKGLLFWSSREFGNNHYVHVERWFSTWLTWTPVSAWWMLALGVGGWWIVRRSAPGADAAMIGICVMWAMLTGFFPVSRYRLPVVPFAVLCAAAGVAELATAQVSRRRKVVAGVLVVGVAFAAFLPDLTGMIRPTGASAFRNVASAAYQLGDLDGARGSLNRALEEDPTDGPSLVLLGRVLIDLGAERGSERLLQEGIDRLLDARGDPRSMGPGVPVIRALMLQGKLQDARNVGVEILKTDGDEPLDLRVEARAHLAVVYLRLGDRATALRLLDEATAAMPEHPAVVIARAEVR